MPKEKKKKDIIALPDRDDKDYFRKLVDCCVLAYEELSNDGLALDYCMVADRKLRAMILNDEYYKAKTKNIYARQRLEEMQEVQYLARLAENGDSGDDDDCDYYEPRDGKKESKKITGIDKDMINMRFKAAQMKRELRAELAIIKGDAERDTVNLMYLTITREEFEKLKTIEIHQGSDDADIDALIGTKEDVPVGTAGTIPQRGKTKVVEENEDDLFDIGLNGEIVERE